MALYDIVSQGLVGHRRTVEALLPTLSGKFDPPPGVFALRLVQKDAALAKVHTRTLADGTPAMSFTRLLAHLATIVRNTLRPKSARTGEATFTLTTDPTSSSNRPST